MRYQDLLDRVAQVTRMDPEEIRKVMAVLPEVFMSMSEGDSVRTPMGVFKMKRRKRKRVLLPDNQGWAYAPEQMRIHFNPGKKMKVDTD